MRLSPAGNSDPATCTDCHSATSNPHNVVRVLDPAASTYPKNIAQTCAKCHDDPKLMDKYGIVEKVYDSYMRSFHGKAMELAPDGAPIQQLDTATCVNCHGAHNIALVSDPNAPVAGMDNLLETCKTCHPDAGPEFVKGFLGHKAVNSDFMPEVYWGGKSFYIFSRAMLAGGVLIVATSISLRVCRGSLVGSSAARRRRNKRIMPSRIVVEEPRTGISITRFDAQQRAQHILIIASFFVLAITGLPLKYSDLGHQRVVDGHVARRRQRESRCITTLPGS